MLHVNSNMFGRYSLTRLKATNQSSNPSSATLKVTAHKTRISMPCHFHLKNDIAEEFSLREIAYWNLFYMNLAYNHFFGYETFSIAMHLPLLWDHLICPTFVG